jgi:hypothetical protein
MINKEEYSDDMEGNLADFGESNLRALVDCIPFGGLLTNNINFLVKPSIEKRKEKWLNLIVDSINVLSDKIDNINKMFQDETFVTFIINTTQSAMRTQQDEKIIMYKNVLINSYICKQIDLDKKMIFLNWLDNLTLTHMKVLSFMNKPSEFCDNPNGSTMYTIAEIMRMSFSDFNDNRQIYENVVKDLYYKGLINTDNISTHMTSSGAFATRTTDVGKEFITFVSNPND